MEGFGGEQNSLNTIDVVSFQAHILLFIQCCILNICSLLNLNYFSIQLINEKILKPLEI